MTIPYTSVAVSGYNANPPSDDGAQTSTNEITWAKHKDKLSDPVKTALESINTNLVTAFALVYGGGATSISSAHTISSASRGKRLSVTNETTVTLIPSATAGTTFVLTIANDGTNVVAIDGDGSELVGGVAILYLFPGESVTLLADGTSAWLLLDDNRSKVPVGTILAGIFTTANYGYVLCTGGTIGDASSGGTLLAKPWAENLFTILKTMSPNAGTETWASHNTVVTPNCRGRAICTLDNLGGSSSNVVTDSAADSLGGTYGTETQACSGSVGTSGATTLSTSQIPSHPHESTSGAAAGGPFGDSGVSRSAVGQFASDATRNTNFTGSTGGGGSHTHTGGTFTGSASNIVQPSIFFGAQIKL